MSYLKEQMIATGIVFSLLPIVAVGLRIRAKKILQTPLAMDDYLIFPALACAVAGGILQVIGAVDGKLGQHQTMSAAGLPVLDHGVAVYEQVKYAEQILSATGLGFVKSSIILFYARIFSVRWFRKLANLMLVIVAIWAISSFFAAMFQCKPISTVWTVLENQFGDKCIHTLAFYYGHSVSDIITDIIILAMPMYPLGKLQLPIRDKLAVGGMFLLGGLVCAASITRLVIFLQVGHAFNRYDVTYNTTPVLFWTVVEVSLAVVSACLPTLRPLFVKRREIGSNSKSSAWPRSSYGGNLHGKMGSLSSVAGLKTRDLAAREAGTRTHIEATEMQNLERSQEGIVVQRDISLENHARVQEC